MYIKYSSLTCVDGNESSMVPPFFPIVAPILYAAAAAVSPLIGTKVKSAAPLTQNTKNFVQKTIVFITTPQWLIF